MSDASGPIHHSAQSATAVAGKRAATPTVIRGRTESSTSVRNTTSSEHRARISVRVPRGPWLNTFESLTNRNFFLLWVGMLFLMAGAQMQMLAQSYLVYDITGSASVLGIINLGIAVPMLTVPLFGGVVADRFEKKTIIQVAQLVAGSLALLIGLAIDFEVIAWQHLLIASMVTGGLWAFMMPARQAIIPQIVGPEKTTNAMALTAAGMSGTTMAAPALAGGIYAFIGPWNVFYLIGALTLAAVVLTTFLPKTGSAGTSAGKTDVLRDIADGISHVWQRRILFVLLLMGLAATMLAMPFRFILPVFVVDIYRQGPDSMGLLVGLMGLGSMFGSLYVASMGQRYRGMGLIVASIMSGIGLVLIAALPVYCAAAGIMLLRGIGDSG
ncbi:MAG: MFS transporter, partial [Chloroflexi bacterium]|nr:MFS transporter [Chloroflexota bacterium]